VSAPALTALQVGDAITPLSRRVTQVQINAYAEASGDPNPIHTNEEFARAVGLPGTIAHGMLSLGILAGAVARWAGGSERLTALGARFSRPLLPGDTLTCSGRVIAVEEASGVVSLAVEAVSDRGDSVLTNGRAQVRLDT